MFFIELYFIPEKESDVYVDDLPCFIHPLLCVYNNVSIVIHTSPHYFKHINRMFSQFIWGNKKPRIRLSEIFGGLKAANVYWYSTWHVNQEFFEWFTNPLLSDSPLGQLERDGIAPYGIINIVMHASLYCLCKVGFLTNFYQM